VSDFGDQLEAFHALLGLGLPDRIPDARTIRLLWEKLAKAGAIKPLFDRFDATLRGAGLGHDYIDDCVTVLAEKSLSDDGGEGRSPLVQTRLISPWVCG
jgi:hypothetical protein